MENQQGPAGQHREPCSILCNNLMVPREKDGEGTVRESGMDMDTLLDLTWRTNRDLLDSTGDSAQYSVITLWFPEGRMKGRDTEFGMETLLCLTWRISKDLQGTLLHVTWQPGWEGSLGENGYLYMDNLDP